MSSLAPAGPYRWLIPNTPEDRVRRLAECAGISLPTARVLLARGYGEPDTVDRFLRPSLDHLHDPFLMLGMLPALDRLRSAIERRHKILLYGDYDVDGATAVAILMKAIELAGGRADYFVPHRITEGYGMRAEVIERAAEQGVGLIVSVDTGIRAAEVVRRACELGIDVIVTDHHLPDAAIPPAHAVLNPKQPGCSYPDKNLCGAGVAFKLAQALLSSLGWPASRVEAMIRSFAKPVAIATVADVVPLTGENRVLVHHGLEGFSNVRNNGLRHLLSVAGFAEGEIPSAGNVAFRIAPRMNAAGRMAHASELVDLLLTQDEERARSIAGRLNALNQERQQTEAAIVNAILDQCLESPVTDADAALVFAGKDWHRGVVGIVASRLVERFHRPVFVLTEDEHGVLHGSARSVPSFHLLEGLESMPELFSKFGGHRQAAGLTLPSANLAEFRTRINGYAAARLTPADFAPQLEIDARLELSELHERAINELLSMAPFGYGNPVPVFAVSGLQVAGEPTVFKDKHLRFNVRQNGRTLTLKAWNMAARKDELAPGASLDAAVTIEDDAFSRSRGYPGWACTIKDFRPASASAVA